MTNDLEVSMNGGVPKWMVDFMENPKQRWMMTGGSPILGNPHIHLCKYT